MRSRSSQIPKWHNGTDAVVVLGHIERGETLHGEVMGHVVQHALVQLQFKYRKPVGVGIIGPGATAEQADVRKHETAPQQCERLYEVATCYLTNASSRRFGVSNIRS